MSDIFYFLSVISVISIYGFIPFFITRITNNIIIIIITLALWILPILVPILIGIYSNITSNSNNKNEEKTVFIVDKEGKTIEIDKFKFEKKLYNNKK